MSTATHEDRAPVAASEGPRSPHDALQWAHDQCGVPGWGGMCLSFVRTGYNLPAVYASAADDWAASKTKHETSSWKDIPVGAPVHFAGSNPDGHIAFYNGDGDICTTNTGTGYPLVQPISTWTDQYGYRMLGWCEDVNGFHVIDPDGGSDIPDSEVVMPYDSCSTNDVHKIPPNGEWANIYVDEDNVQTIISSPGPFLAYLHLYIDDLPEGAKVIVRFINVDTEDGGKNAVDVAHYPTIGFVASSGTTYIEASQMGNLGKPTTKGKTSRRLRAQIATDSPQWAHVTHCGARWFH